MRSLPAARIRTSLCAPVHYTTPGEEWQQVASFGRYRFGIPMSFQPEIDVYIVYPGELELPEPYFSTERLGAFVLCQTAAVAAATAVIIDVPPWRTHAREDLRLDAPQVIGAAKEHGAVCHGGGRPAHFVKLVFAQHLELGPRLQHESLSSGV